MKALGEHGLLAEFRPAGKSGYGPPAADGKQPRVGSWERADGHWRPFRGRIVDLIGPAFALDGIDTSDLSEHLDAYGLPALDVPPAVRINEDEAAQLLDVARAIHGLAVAVDAEAALWLTPAEDRREGRARVGLRFLVSPGSLHAKMREASGATPPLARQVPDDESLDRYTAGAHGGLVGCVVPGEILPGNDVDVHGSYPAAWSLLGCDRFFSAAELIEEDCAEDLHQLAEQVAAGAVEPLFDPATYRHLGLARADVEVSDGQVFPVEVAGDPGEPGRFAMRRIGALLQLSCSWPDVLASSIASGQALRVPWAKRLVSHGSGEPRPVPLRDGVVVLPGEDPVVVAVRLRDAAKATGNQRLAGQLRLFGERIVGKLRPSRSHIPPRSADTPLDARGNAGALDLAADRGDGAGGRPALARPASAPCGRRGQHVPHLRHRRRGDRGLARGR